MAELAVLAAPYRDRFQKLLDAAPADHVPLVSFMVNHEASVIRMAQREAAGDGLMEHDRCSRRRFQRADPCLVSTREVGLGDCAEKR